MSLAKKVGKKHPREFSVEYEKAWSVALLEEPLALDVHWCDGIGEFEKEVLIGWRAPLWRWVGHTIELLRPEGRWIANAPRNGQAVLLRESGAHGWSSKRGITMASKVREGVWFDQHGWAVRLEDLEQEKAPPLDVELSNMDIQSRGEFCKWELSEDGKAVAWLDDSFEQGPFCARVRGEWLIVSNGKKKVVYWMGRGHWAAPMAKRGLLMLQLGRGGGWEAEALCSPLMLE